jgi:hypothetical protein
LLLPGEALRVCIDIAGHLHFTPLEKRAQETEFGAGGEETELCECLNIYEMESCTVLHIANINASKRIISPGKGDEEGNL